ncbi:fatty acid 2-hydroxylase [Aricia agestis]|uniref:fatty acid 2-hydroxylase n=1 Tax=Aricia agestis TaxID=91739 RepID=UPI001C202F09|nr:fatty acid 2-hydroxylase [Aricia agestis]
MTFPVKFGAETYDIKAFLRDHPGGTNTLEKFRGKSILSVMEAYGHSVSAYHMLSDFRVDDDVNLTGSLSENGRILTKEESVRDAEEIAFLEELESRLDWSKPLLCQLHKIAPHYQQWVNCAVHRKCRLFANPMLESLTYTPWYLVPMFWIPIISYLAASLFYRHVFCEDCKDGLYVYQFFSQLTAGFVIWTILEYSLHRWLFHFNPGNSLNLIKIHFLIHGIHHKVPFDGLRQVFPPIPAAALATAIYTTVKYLLSYPMIKFTGGLVGYLVYDMTHYYVHHGSPRAGTYLYEMKRYHSNHHFLNHDKAFGITSKMWDHVFKTFVNVRKLAISLHWRSNL